MKDDLSSLPQCSNKEALLDVDGPVSEGCAKTVVFHDETTFMSNEDQSTTQGDLKEKNDETKK